MRFLFAHTKAVGPLSRALAQRRSFGRRGLATSAVVNGQNLVEKIVQSHAVETDMTVQSGDFISVRPAHVMTHDNSAAVMNKYNQLGVDKVNNNRQIVFTLDHNVQDKSDANLTKYKNIEEFASKHGIDFYPAGRGIGHQIMVEEGYAFPLSMVVASDSHSNMYGGIGCLGTPVVRTDAAAIWATGKTWWQVPPVAKVVLEGQLAAGVTGKDVILTLCEALNKDEVLNHAVEFHGEGVKSLSMDERLTIANMTTEWGALAGLFPVDEITLDWLKAREQRLSKRKVKNPRITPAAIEELASNTVAADLDATYNKEYVIDLGSIWHTVAGPNSVKDRFTGTGQSITKAYLVSCVNSRAVDLKQAADVVRGNKINENVEFYVAAASSEVQQDSTDSGDWTALIDAGARPLPPGCGPCIGLGEGLLQAGEVGISATNRNFRGRMGHPDAEVYLASPAVVAASAVAGVITIPESQGSSAGQLVTVVDDGTKPKTGGKVAHAPKLREGFPKSMEGEVLFCPTDNINTDGIYPGKYTYREDITPEQQAEVVMENYDLEFAKTVKNGDVLITGYNFGTGSSREQAATALKHAGVSVVICGSVNTTYKRNALNNGLLVLEMPDLVNALKDNLGANKLTIRSSAPMTAKIDFAECQLELKVDGATAVYGFHAVGTVAQDLILSDGLENWIRNEIS